MFVAAAAGIAPWGSRDHPIEQQTGGPFWSFRRGVDKSRVASVARILQATAASRKEGSALSGRGAVMTDPRPRGRHPTIRGGALMVFKSAAPETHQAGGMSHPCAGHSAYPRTRARPFRHLFCPGRRRRRLRNAALQWGRRRVGKHTPRSRFWRHCGSADLRYSGLAAERE
ncbi:hypothetical protein MTO96_020615 [Rhipicephalus appendiculatus]